MVRLKPPKEPQPEPPPEGFVIFISTDNGFDIDNRRAGDYKEDTKPKRKREKRKGKMKKLFIAALFLVGCVHPSAMMVNRDGQGVRCATTGGGYGIAGAIAISAAQGAYDNCVSDYNKIGYVKIPDVSVGITPTDWKGPVIAKEIQDPAKTAGILVGDQILSIDGKPIASLFDTFKALNSKSVGDKVKVVVKRDNHELTFEPVLAARGE